MLAAATGASPEPASQVDANALVPAQAEKVAEAFGPDDPRLARTLVRISRLGEGGVAEEQVRLERALAIQERSLGREHLELAETLEALAMTYDWRNDGSTATLAALQRALAIRGHTQDDQHPEVARSLTTLAYGYDGRRMFREAEAAHRTAAATYRDTVGPSDSRTRFAEEQLASLYLGHGDYDQAVALLETTLPADSARASRGPRSASTKVGSSYYGATTKRRCITPNK